MLHVGEVEITCDMAETYQIYITDWYNPPYPVSYLAKLAEGLSLDSRIKRKIANSKLTLNEALNALLLDKMSILVWQRSKDGIKGRNMPESVYRKLMGLDDKPKDDLEKFATEEDFEEWYKSKMR